MLNGEGRPAAGTQTDHAHIRTFLIADVRGYTVFTHENGDEAAARWPASSRRSRAKWSRAAAGPSLSSAATRRSRSSTRARQAIRAAVELQRRFVDETVADPTLPLAVGIGLDAGEAVAVEDGYRGGALNLAARLCAIAAPAEILASPAVMHLARKVDGVAYVDRGRVSLKGLAEPVQVIRLRAEANDAADDMAFRRALGRRRPDSRRPFRARSSPTPTRAFARSRRRTRPTSSDARRSSSNCSSGWARPASSRSSDRAGAASRRSCAPD